MNQQEEYEKRIQEARQEILSVLRKYQLAIKPILHITETGLLPVMTFINTTQDDLENVEILMPNDLLKK